MKRSFLGLALACICSAQQYSTKQVLQDGITVVHLHDAQRDIDVTVVPSFGNRAVAFTVHGKNLLYFPSSSLKDFVQHPGLNGVPFLAPWANRLDASSYWVNGKQFHLNPDLKNYDSDGNRLPIHGLLQNSALWQISAATADEHSAYVTCRLTLWTHPELMAQWPFAEEYEMTYRLSDGTLEVRTAVTNRSVEPVPVVIGFHPYYRIPGKPRAQWVLQLPARQSIPADSRLIPTGELVPLRFPNPIPLKDHILDDGVTDFQRGSDGRARFIITSGDQQIELLFGPHYPVAILWAPPARQGPDSEFVCVEPMTAPTDAINLAHQGKYAALQSVPPGGTWSESFWIKPSGF